MLFALALVACATSPDIEERWNARIGLSESQVVAQVGPPVSVYLAPDGSRTLTCSRNGSAQYGGYSQMQPVTATTRGMVGGAPFSATTTSYQTTQTPVFTVEMRCTLHAKFVGDRLVTWQAEGNAC